MTLANACLAIESPFIVGARLRNVHNVWVTILDSPRLAIVSSKSLQSLSIPAHVVELLHAVALWNPLRGIARSY